MCAAKCGAVSSKLRAFDASVWCSVCDETEWYVVWECSVVV